MPITNSAPTKIDFKVLYEAERDRLNALSSRTASDISRLAEINTRLTALGGCNIEIQALFSNNPVNPAEILDFMDACFTSGAIDFTRATGSAVNAESSDWLNKRETQLNSDLRRAGLSVADKTDKQNELDDIAGYREFLQKSGDIELSAGADGVVDFGKLIATYQAKMEKEINRYIRSSARHRGASGFGRLARNRTLRGWLAGLVVGGSLIGAGIHYRGRIADVAKNTKDAITRTDPEKQRKEELKALSDTARDAIALGEVWQSVIDDGQHIHRWNELSRLNTTANLTGRQQVIRNALEQAEKEYQEYLRDMSRMRRENPEGFKRVKQERLAGYKGAWQKARSGFDALYIGKEIKKGVKRGKIDVSKMSDVELRKLHAVEASLIPTAADHGMGIYAAEWLETGHVSPEGFTPKLPHGRSY